MITAPPFRTVSLFALSVLAAPLTLRAWGFEPAQHAHSPARTEAGAVQPILENTAPGSFSGAPSGEEIDRALRRGVQFIWSQQDRTGRWSQSIYEEPYPAAPSALAAWTLLRAGEPVNDARFRRIIQLLRDRTEIKSTFARAMTLLLWCEVDPGQLEREIDEDNRFLVIDEQDDGAWGVGRLIPLAERAPGDESGHSNLVLMALDEAARCGATASPGIWRRSEQYWLRSLTEAAPRGEDHPDATAGFVASTAGGLASLYVLYDRLHLDAHLRFNGRFKARCGQESPSTVDVLQALDAGRQRLANALSQPSLQAEDDRPRHRFDRTEPFALFQFARLGVLSGAKRFGEIPWADTVSHRLVASQQDDGSWGDLVESCFAVLALLEARRPVLVNKLAYPGWDPWQTDPRDAANFVAWLNQRTSFPLAWQSSSLADNPEDIWDAPLLLITGHEVPVVDESARRLLRDYVDWGGTILVSPCCSRAEFAEGMHQFFADLFPRLTPGPLPPDHPLWTAGVAFEPVDNLVAFRNHCRASVFILPGGSCCVWQQDLRDRFADRFELAERIAVYATHGREPAPRPGRTFRTDQPTAVRKLTIARLAHGGDWWSIPGALGDLSRVLAENAGLALDPVDPITVSDPVAGGADLLWVTGFEFSPAGGSTGASLKSYIDGGGTIIASPTCTSEAFDRAFTRLMLDSFGPQAWERIPSEDPLLTGSFAPGLASTLHRMDLRQPLGGNPPARLDYPVLFGVRQGERWGLIYSPADLTCGVSQTVCPTCVGFAPADARAVAGNLILYAAQQKRPAVSDGP